MKKRILVVDDQVSYTRLLKLYLEQTDHYVVREENDSRAALVAALLLPLPRRFLARLRLLGFSVSTAVLPRRGIVPASWAWR